MKQNNFICHNCGSKKAKIKYEFPIRNILQCVNCHLMVVNPIPTRQEIEKVYDENYFINEKLTLQDVSGIYGYVDYISERVNKQHSYKKICHKINEYLIDKSTQIKLLDFGCGLGFFLDSAYDFGVFSAGCRIQPKCN